MALSLGIGTIKLALTSFLLACLSSLASATSPSTTLYTFSLHLLQQTARGKTARISTATSTYRTAGITATGTRLPSAGARCELAAVRRGGHGLNVHTHYRRGRVGQLTCDAYQFFVSYCAYPLSARRGLLTVSRHRGLDAARHNTFADAVLLLRYRRTAHRLTLPAACFRSQHIPLQYLPISLTSSDVVLA